jgi:D-alanyl-D-alanine carboxypeptidase
MSLARASLLLAAVAMVAACGGSGATAPAPASPTTPPSTAPVASATPLPTASEAAPSPSAAALWTGPALTTTPMSAADAAAFDTIAPGAFAAAPGLNGMWIGIWDPAKGFYSQAYGNAVKDGAKATIDDVGQIGSVTKTFTVTAILEQIAAGTITLDSTIKDVLPDLAATYPTIADVTVRQLAGMQSPIQDYANTGVSVGTVIKDSKHVFTADELIADGMSLPLVAPEKYDYSTTNTIILGEMLEKLTGKPVDEVVTEIARKLGMADTALPPPANQTVLPEPSSHGYVGPAVSQSLAAIGLEIPPGTDVTDWSMSWGGAGGAMYSTIADLGKWAASGLGTSLLPEDLAAERFKTNKLASGITYGLGLEDWGNGWFGHSGQTLGFESLVAYNRNTGAAFVAIVNDGGGLMAAKLLAVNQFPDLAGLLK